MNWPVLVQVNAISLIDEGVGILDFFQEAAAATGILVAAHGFNPEIIERGKIWSGHGPVQPHGSAGGLFAGDHPQFYRGSKLGAPKTNDPPFADFDVMEVATREAATRGLECHVYILESAATGGHQRNVTGWPQILEIDVEGRRGKLPCVNHPEYRAWKLSLLEDLYSSYDFAGILWGVERWGPLHQAGAGESPGCFCAHCQAVGASAGLDWQRVKQGYVAFMEGCRAVRAGGAPRGTLLRTLLAFPETLAWEAAWTRSYLTLHRELYGAAKWLAPERKFGLGLWHYAFINPLLAAEWDLAAFARSADYIRPILYHVAEGPRLKHYLHMLNALLPGVREETLWTALAEYMGLELPAVADFATQGLPASFVTQGVRAVRAQTGAAVPIYAGIGIDIYQENLARRMQPEDVEAAVRAAVDGGADGITVSRNYAEMQQANVAAVGRTLRSVRR